MNVIPSVPVPGTLQGDMGHEDVSLASASASPGLPVGKTKRRKAWKEKPRIGINLSKFKFEVVHRMARSLSWGVSLEDDDPVLPRDGGPSKVKKKRERNWSVYWTDTSVSMERVMRLESFQVRGRGWKQGG